MLKRWFVALTVTLISMLILLLFLVIELTVLDRLRVDIGGTTVFSNGSGMPQADLAKVRNQSDAVKQTQKATELRDATAAWIREHHDPDTRQVWDVFEKAAELADYARHTLAELRDGLGRVSDFSGTATWFCTSPGPSPSASRDAAQLLVGCLRGRR